MPPLSTHTTDDVLRRLLVSLATPATIELQLAAACRELAACGALRRTRLVASLRAKLSQQQQRLLDPLRVVALVNVVSLLRCGVLGVHSLCELLPTVQAASSLIQQAACSQAVVLSLLQGQHCQGQPVLSLLEGLLGARFDAAASAGDAFAASGPEQQQQQQYVEQVLQSLQQAACECEALAACLFSAADSCSVVHEAEQISSWMRQLLQQLLHAHLQPPGGAHTGSAWPALALQPRRWRVLLELVLRHVPLQDVLSMLQDSLAPATQSVRGLTCMCDLLAALAACEQRGGVAELVTRSLATAVAQSCSRSMLPPLLLAGQLLARGTLSKSEVNASLQQAVEGALSAKDGHADTALPALCDALSLLMLGANAAALEAQVQLLRQLRASAALVPSLLQAEVARTEGVLADVLLQRKQAAQAQQGSKAVSRSDLSGFTALLESFQQQQPDPASGRRRLSAIMVGRWRMWAAKGTAQSFSEAFINAPPETLSRATACFEYIQELQEAKLVKAGQAERFTAACFACGLDLTNSSTHQQQQQQGEAAGGSARVKLQLLLSRLPAVVAASDTSASGVAVLMSRISEHVRSILQPGQHDSALGPPAAKKQRTSAAAAPAAAAGQGSVSSAAVQEEAAGEVLGMLLAAYEAAAAAVGFGPDGGLGWRLAFARMMAEQPELHGVLLQRLRDSQQGTLPGAAAADALAQACEQALRHGSLTALLAASRMHNVQLLPATAAPPAAADALVVQVPAVAGMFTWSSVGGGGSSSGAAAAGGTVGHLHGLELVQDLLGRAATATLSQRCCAASFWAGYLGLLRKTCGQWCAGPWGPYGSAASFSSSPGASTAVVTQLTCVAPATADAAGGGRTADAAAGLVGYVPPQLAALLQQLATGLGADASTQQGAGLGAAQAEQAVAAGALQACSRALRVSAVKWACQL